MSTDYLSRDSFDGAGGGSPYPSYGDLPENFIEDGSPQVPPAAAPAIAAAPTVESFINDERAARPANDRIKTIASRSVANLGPVVAEAVEASDDNDTATRQTVEMMCGYVRAALTDPYIGYLAQGALRLFCPRQAAAGQLDPLSAAWAVFWFLKHRVKKTYDEATMFKLGVPNQQDLLTDPRVLLRQVDAAEDCDGFTMAAWALLQSLGVETCMVTVACDPADRSRWSHVFTLVKLPNGAWMPLDCSHGVRPGWMVPRAHISRWQAWDLDGKPIEAKPPAPSTLHGYMYRPAPLSNRRGVGDDTPVFDAVSPFLDTTGAGTGLAPIDFSSGGSFFTGGMQLGTPGTGTSSWAMPSGTNNWLGPLFDMLGTTAKVIQNETLPVGTVIRNPDGSVSANLGPAGAAAGLNLGSLFGGVGGSSTLLWVGGGILLLVIGASLLGGKK